MAPITEKELLAKLAEAEREFQDAKKSLADAKRRLYDSESLVIETKLKRDNLKEELRVHRKTTPNYEPTVREQEIQRFREAYPEVCEEALERDRNKP